MSRQVLFNGAVLVRPGAATKIDASRFQNVSLSGLGTVGLIGEADGGQPRVLKIWRSAADVKNYYRSGNLVEAAQIVADPGNDPRIPAGASVIVTYKINNSGQASLTHDTAFLFKSRDYGLHTNSIRVAISSSGGNLRTLMITGLDINGNVVTETSPEFGSTSTYGKMSIQYVGAGSAATMTITATTLTTSVTGGPGGENLSLAFADYPTLTALVFYIDGLAAYTASSLITNANEFDTTNLDAVAGQDIRTAAYTTMAHNFDLADWANKNSSLVSVTLTKGQTGPRTVLTATALSGGSLGTSANSDWVTGLAALGTLRINQVVTLASADAAAAQGTYTIASINSSLESHCKTLSATAGKSERQGWASISATKTNFIAAARTLNSEHVSIVSQQVTRPSAVTGNLTVFSEWALACILAGMRAGAPLGEPLTHKFIKCNAIMQDSTWVNNNTSDVADLLLNGCMSVAEIPSQGFRIEKGITTYTKTDNDAFTEETIVQGWKNISYEWRTLLEEQFTGRPGEPAVVQRAEEQSKVILRKLRDEGAIADSIVDGVQTDGFKNIKASLSGDVMSVSGEVSPTPGINFILNTIVLIPAQVSA